MAEHALRRNALMQQMGSDSIAVLSAAPVAIKNNGIEYPYRQQSDFQYLSGFPESDAVLVLIPNRKHGEYILFCKEKNVEQELWHGSLAGQDDAVTLYGADDAFPINDIDDILPGLIEGKKRVYYSIGTDSEFDARLMDWVSSIRARVGRGAQPPGEFITLDYLLHDMRLYKSIDELGVIRRAAGISVKAHLRAMRVCQPGLYEFNLETELNYEFGQGGAKHNAYNSIVASGNNSCVLHYVNNDDRLTDGDLVLIDAGCEIECYASDITRTFPVSGTFSTEQKAIYDLVLAAQEAAFSVVTPGKQWNDPHEQAIRVITEGLVALDLLQGDVPTLIASDAYKEFYMHRTGHWLGLDVHDVGEYKVANEWRVLEVGMVMTVEPGIYIAPNNLRVPEQWRGIGVRIEDDIVVTPNGYELLTVGLPRTTNEIEELMSVSRIIS
ncbi:UNVERIFIED_CONTAM: hypothetical protein GTU68_035394 [Idotea baltica]|nr:hypothetical protein [Idotea baltica]